MPESDAQHLRLLSFDEPPNQPAERSAAADAAKTTAKNKGKKRKCIDNCPEVHRGMETLLRSSYRTQLDMAKLADTKASIMISITGLIISVLMATGGAMVAFSEKTIFVLPIIVLLVSGFISLFFAIMSARPEESNGKRPAHDPDLLAFEDMAEIGGTEYVAMMNGLMKNRERIYEEMFRHIHRMSVGLKKKFRLLRVAYTTFIAGVCLCIATFIGIVTIGDIHAGEGSASTGAVIQTPAHSHLSQ